MQAPITFGYTDILCSDVNCRSKGECKVVKIVSVLKQSRAGLQILAGRYSLWELQYSQQSPGWTWHLLRQWRATQGQSPLDLWWMTDWTARPRVKAERQKRVVIILIVILPKVILTISFTRSHWNISFYKKNIQLTLKKSVWRQRAKGSFSAQFFSGRS